jgi:hypothetical protein
MQQVTLLSFGRLRNLLTSGQSEPGRGYPTSIAGLRIWNVRDLTEGHAYDGSQGPSFKPVLPVSSDHMVTFYARGQSVEDSLNVTLRASGTEPKVCFSLCLKTRNKVCVADQILCRGLLSIER